MMKLYPWYFLSKISWKVEGIQKWMWELVKKNNLFIMSEHVLESKGFKI